MDKLFSSQYIMEIRMGFIRLTASVILAFTLLTPGLFASGFETTGLGLKARGMGGAFRALANDWTAAYYNPAGYAFVYDNQLGANVGVMHLRNELTPDYRLGSNYELGFFNDQTIYNHHEIYTMPSAGFLVRLPLWGETVFGLSVYQPFDYSISWTLYRTPFAYNDSALSQLPYNQYLNNLDVVAFQLTAAREFIEDKLSIGIGLQFLRGDLAFNNLYMRENPLDSTTYPDVLSDRPYDKIPEFTKNDGNGWGFGLKGGMLWKLNDKMSVAFTASIPFDITIKGTTAFNFIMPSNNGLITDTDTTGYQPGKIGYLFAIGDPISFQSDFETKLKLPPSVGAGFTYEVNDKLQLAFDIEYTFWSRFEGFEFYYTGFGSLPLDSMAIVKNFFTYNLTNPVDWNNAGKVMAGCRYEYNENITFLGGISADQSSVRDGIGFIPQFIDTGDKYGFNAGVLFNIQRWEIGLVSSFYVYPDMTIYNTTDIDGDHNADQFPGVYKASTFETILAFNYWF